MKKKEVQTKKALCFTTETTLNKIGEVAEIEVGKMMQEVEARHIVPSGPIEFVYHGATSDMDKPFELTFVIPVAEEKEVSAPYVFKDLNALTCITHVYEGDLNKIGPVYEELYKELEWNKIQPTDEIREVYLKYEGMTSEANITEIQIGVVN